MFSMVTILGFIDAVFRAAATRYCPPIGNTLFRPPGRVTFLFSPKERAPDSHAPAGTLRFSLAPERDIEEVLD
jgi:hypothetical protein